jgi:cold shock protein
MKRRSKNMNAGRTVGDNCSGGRSTHLPNCTVTGYTVFIQRAMSVQTTNMGDAQMAEGTIKKLTNKGFGFIDIGSGKDLFFHSSSVQGVTFEQLREGQKVSYTEGQGQKGPCAVTVKPV